MSTDSKHASYKEKAISEWELDDLVGWINEKRKNLLNDDEIEKLRKAGVIGHSFLSSETHSKAFFIDDCGIIPGKAVSLAKLARDLAEEDKDLHEKSKSYLYHSEELATKRLRLEKEPSDLSRKRLRLSFLPGPNVPGDREQAGNVEVSDTAFKRPRLENKVDATLPELAERARMRRDRIRQLIENLDRPSVPFSEDSVPFPSAVFQLSNPAFHTKLPFPFVGFKLPGRFQIDPNDDEHNWFYVGREKFAELPAKVKEISADPRYSDLILYGTRGYGKSHLLAALVCYLAAGKGKVVYIPDCREFFKKPVPYMRAAMLFAWADDENEQQNIMTLDTLEEIDKFFQAHPDVMFVIDQLNALEKARRDDEATANKKAEVRRWLQSLRPPEQTKAILSSSANNHSILYTASTQNSGQIMYVHGGLTRKEMDHWWKRREMVKLGDYTKDEVEDFTGKIPLLLDNSVVKDEKNQPFTIDLGTKYFLEIYEQAVTFERQIKLKCKDNMADLERHNIYMKACLSGQAVSPSSKMIPELVDHRYFFDEFNEDRRVNVANYTCGLVRNAVATELHEKKVNLSDNDFWNSLLNHINNPCITGFIIEQAILSRISFSGLNIAGRDINTSMSVVLFSGSFPNFQTGTTGKSILYCPQKFNYRGIDGIIVRIEPKPMTNRIKQKLFMYPLQITLSPDKHSDSHKIFLSNYESWTHDLQQFEVVPTFLWISPKEACSVEHKPIDKDNWPAHSEEYIPISQVHPDLWAFYLHAKQHWQTQEAPEPPARGDRQGGTETQGVSEGPERPEEQMRSDGPSAAGGLSGGEARGSGGRRSGGRRSGGSRSGRRRSGGRRSGGRRSGESGSRGGADLGRGDRRKVYQSMKVTELKQELKSRMLRQTGKKNDLVDRLVEDDKTKGAR